MSIRFFESVQCCTFMGIYLVSLNKTLLAYVHVLLFQLISCTHTHTHTAIESLEWIQMILQFCALSAPEVSETAEDIVGTIEVSWMLTFTCLVSASLQSGFNILHLDSFWGISHFSLLGLEMEFIPNVFPLNKSLLNPQHPIVLTLWFLNWVN